MHPPDPPDVSLIVPAYREARRLPRTIPPLLAHIAERSLRWEVRIVDDGSDDGTADAARALGDAGPVVVQVEPHRGKGAAVRAGMLAARAPARVMCDADMAMPASWIQTLLDRLDRGADIAVASRQVEGARRVGEPWPRHVMGRVFNGVVRVAAVPGIQDTQCGFKAFRGDVARRLFRRSIIDGFAFDVEILFLAHRAGLRLEEVPVVWHHDADSRISPLRDARLMLGEIARIRLNAALGLYDGL